MNTFRLFQLRRIDLLFYIKALFSYNDPGIFQRPIDAWVIARTINELTFAKARAINVLVKRLRRRFDTQVLEQMNSLLGPEYTRAFCQRYKFPYPTQFFLSF